MIFKLYDLKLLELHKANKIQNVQNPRENVCETLITLFKKNIDLKCFKSKLIFSSLHYEQMKTQMNSAFE